KICLGVFIALACGEIHPFVSFDKICLHTMSTGIADSQFILSHIISLFRRFSIPLYCFHLILRHAVALKVTASQFLLSSRRVLIRRFSIPQNCFCEILRDTSSIQIARAKVGFTISISMICRHAKPFYSFYIILLKAQALVEVNAEKDLSI